MIKKLDTKYLRYIWGPGDRESVAVKINEIIEWINNYEDRIEANHRNILLQANAIADLQDQVETQEGNSVAQQSDGNLEKALKVLEEHYEKNATKFDTADYFQVTYVIDFLRDLYQLKARTTDKEQPE